MNSLNKNLIECGKLGRPCGLKGELLFDCYNSDIPISVGDEVYIDIEGEDCLFIISSLKNHGKRLRLGFENVNDRDEAARLVNKILFISEASLKKLSDEEYYSYQLLGMRVFDASGKELGVLKEIFSTKAHDIYGIRNSEGRELLLPAVKDFIVEINLANGIITVKLIEGMEFV